MTHPYTLAQGGRGRWCSVLYMYFTVRLAVGGALSGGWGMGVGVARVLVCVAQVDYG